MILLDHRDGMLSSRVRAAEDLRQDLTRVAAGGTIVVDLGDNVAATSWVDGYLVNLVRMSPNHEVVVVTDSELNRAHLSRVLASRALRVRVSASVAAAERGDTEMIPAA